MQKKYDSKESCQGCLALLFSSQLQDSSDAESWYLWNASLECISLMVCCSFGNGVGGLAEWHGVFRPGNGATLPSANPGYFSWDWWCEQSSPELSIKGPQLFCDEEQGKADCVRGALRCGVKGCLWGLPVRKVQMGNDPKVPNTLM